MTVLASGSITLARVNDGSDALSISVSSSNGLDFKNGKISTTLTAHVFKGAVELTQPQITALGCIKWFQEGSANALANGTTYRLTTDKPTYSIYATLESGGVGNMNPQFGTTASGLVYVKGRNLITNSGTLKDWTVYQGGTYTGNRYQGSVNTEEKFNDCTTLKTTRSWQGLYVNFHELLPKHGLQAGDTVTLSVWAKFDGIPDKEAVFTCYRTGVPMDGHSKELQRKIPKASVTPNEWFRLVYTFALTEDSFDQYTTRIESDYYENSDYTTPNANVWFACPQLEIGDTVTDWKPAPEDEVIL